MGIQAFQALAVKRGKAGRRMKFSVLPKFESIGRAAFG